MTGFLTIISKNYLPYARVLMRSVARFHPEAARFVLLTDDPDGFFDPPSEAFQVLLLSDLASLPRPRWFQFRYSVLELNTAVKPYVLAHLFGTTSVDSLFYLDPDIELYAPLTAMEQALEQGGANVLLTPHLTAPLPDDGCEPTELSILRSGTYNLGFVALRRGVIADELLRWWQAHLEYECRLDFAAGLFVDQRWMDLAPGLFDGVRIWREPQYNVAYWNLPARQVEPGRTVDGAPLVFFHFSGFDASNPERFSKYQTRFRLPDQGPLRELALAYAALLRDAGIERSRLWPYTHRYLHSGMAIPDLCRSWDEPTVDDPFDDEPFLLYWNARPPNSLLTRFAKTLCATRPELAGQAEPEQLTWLLFHGKHEHSLPEPLLAPLRATWRELHPARTDGSAIVVPAPPPILWPGLPEIAEQIYRTRTDLQRLFSPADRAAYTQWLLSSGSQEYALTPEELAQCEEAHRVAVAELPSAMARLRHTIPGQLRGRRGAAPDAAGRRELLLNPPAAPTPNLVVDAADPVLRHFAGVCPGSPEGITITLVRPPTAATVAYLYDCFPRELPADGTYRELWVPSSFLQDYYGPQSSTPVLRMPPPLRGVPQRQKTHAGWQVLAVLEASADLASMIRAFDIASVPGSRLTVYMTEAAPDHPGRSDIAFVAGEDLDSALDPYLSTADCFLTLARRDGFGYALGRALASGIPAICTAYAGHLDVAPAGTAYLIDYRLVVAPSATVPWAEPNLSDVVHTLRAIAADPGRASAVAQAGRKHIEDTFSPGKIAAALEYRLLALQATALH